MFDWIIHNIPSVIAVCIAFGFIITIHELGHFIMARRVGIRCPRFSIGFGPRLWSFWYHGTEFSISLLPLGGYVMMLGEDPESDEKQTDFELVASHLPDGVLPAEPEAIVAAMEAYNNEEIKKAEEKAKNPASENADDKAADGASAMDSQDEASVEASAKDVADGSEAGDGEDKAGNGVAKAGDGEDKKDDQPEYVYDPLTAEGRKRFKSVVEHVRWLPKRVYSTARELEGNFNDKTVPQRMAVIIGGVTMNFISALILFWIVGLCYGLVDLTPNSLPVVMKVFEGSPAETAGMKYGDRVESVGGQKVVSGTDMIKAVGEHPCENTPIVVRRGDKTLELNLVPYGLIGSITVHPDKTENGCPIVTSSNVYGIAADKDAAEQMPKEGDVITSVDGKAVTSVDSLLEYFRVLSETPGDAPVEVTFGCKDGSTRRMKLYAYEYKPVGKMGIMPAQVTEFKFIDKNINEVSAVEPGSLADKGGFKVGDIIYLVNGARVADEASCNEVLKKLAGSGQEIVFDLARGDQHEQVLIKSDIDNAHDLGLTFRPITFGMIVGRSFTLCGRLIIAPVIIIQQMCAKIISPALVKASMSGPLGIMQMIFELSDDGLGKFLYIVALINAAVGAFNVLPFPALDGARFFILCINWIRGKELDYRKEAMIHQAGLYILLGLVILVTILDVQRLFAGVPLTK
ncbi:MAG: site-2 protease family protein [bacterium]|nr:site-2 protease family protein [bacterium]